MSRRQLNQRSSARDLNTSQLCLVLGVLLTCLVGWCSCSTSYQFTIQHGPPVLAPANRRESVDELMGSASGEADQEAQQLQQLHQVVDTVAQLLNEEEEERRLRAPSSNQQPAAAPQVPALPIPQALQGADLMSESAIRQAIEELERVQQQERSRLQEMTSAESKQRPQFVSPMGDQSPQRQSALVECLIDELGEEILEDQLAAATQEAERMVSQRQARANGDADKRRQSPGEPAPSSQDNSISAAPQKASNQSNSSPSSSSTTTTTMPTTTSPTTSNPSLVMGQLDSLDSELAGSLTNDFYSFHAGSLGARDAPSDGQTGANKAARQSPNDLDSAAQTRDSQQQQPQSVGGNGLRFDFSQPAPQINANQINSRPQQQQQQQQPADQDALVRAFRQQTGANLNINPQQQQQQSQFSNQFQSSTLVPILSADDFWRPSSAGGQPVASADQDLGQQYSRAQQLPPLPASRFQSLGTPGTQLFNGPQSAPNNQQRGQHIHFTGHGFVTSDPFGPQQSNNNNNNVRNNQQQVPFSSTPQPIISVVSGGESAGSNSVSWNPPAAINPPPPPPPPQVFSQPFSSSTQASSGPGSPLFRGSFQNLPEDPETSQSPPQNVLVSSFRSSQAGPPNQGFVSSTEANSDFSSSTTEGGRPNEQSGSQWSPSANTNERDVSSTQARPSIGPFIGNNINNQPVPSSPFSPTTEFPPPVTSTASAAGAAIATTTARSQNGLTTVGPPPPPTNTTGKKEDMVIYYYYYYDDNKNATVVAKNISAANQPAGGQPIGNLPLEAAIEADGGVEDTPYMDDPVAQPVPVSSRQPQLPSSTTPASTSTTTARALNFAEVDERNNRFQPIGEANIRGASFATQSPATTRRGQSFSSTSPVSLTGTSTASTTTTTASSTTARGRPALTEETDNEDNEQPEEFLDDQQRPPVPVAAVNSNSAQEAVNRAIASSGALPSRPNQHRHNVESSFTSAAPPVFSSTFKPTRQPQQPQVARQQQQFVSPTEAGPAIRGQQGANRAAPQPANTRGQPQPVAASLPGDTRRQPASQQANNNNNNGRATNLSNASRYGTSNNNLQLDPSFAIDPANPAPIQPNDQQHQRNPWTLVGGSPQSAQSNHFNRNNKPPVQPTDELTPFRAPPTPQRQPATQNFAPQRQPNQQAAPPARQPQQPTPVSGSRLSAQSAPVSPPTRQFFPESSSSAQPPEERQPVRASNPQQRPQQQPPRGVDAQQFNRPTPIAPPKTFQANNNFLQSQPQPQPRPSSAANPNDLTGELNDENNSGEPLDDQISPNENRQSPPREPAARFNQPPSAPPASLQPAMSNGRPSSSEGNTGNGFTRSSLSTSPVTSAPPAQFNQRPQANNIQPVRSSFSTSTTVSSPQQPSISFSTQQSSSSSSSSAAPSAPTTLLTTTTSSTTTPPPPPPTVRATTVSTPTSTTTTTTTTTTTPQPPATDTTESSDSLASSTRRKFGNRNNRFQTRLSASRASTSTTTSAPAAAATSSTSTTTTTRRPTTTRKSSKQLFAGRRRLGSSTSSPASEPDSSGSPASGSQAAPASESSPSGASPSTVSASRARFGNSFSSRSRSTSGPSSSTTTTTTAPTLASADSKPASLFGAQRATFKPRIPFLKNQKATTATSTADQTTSADATATSPDQASSGSPEATGKPSDSSPTASSSAAAEETALIASNDNQTAADPPSRGASENQAASSSSSAMATETTNENKEESPAPSSSPTATNTTSTTSAPNTSTAAEQATSGRTQRPKRPLFASRQRNSSLFGNRRSNDTSSSAAAATSTR